MRFRIEWVSVLSALKLGCLWGGCMSLVVAVPALFCVLSVGLVPLGSRDLQSFQVFIMQLGIFRIAVGIVGAIFTSGITWLIGALIYNLLADLFGGLEIGLARIREFRQVESMIDPTDTPKPKHDGNRYDDIPSESVKAWSRENQPRPKERRY